MANPELVTITLNDSFYLPTGDYGIALYHISEPMTTRATFNATANNCDAYPGHCNASVTPWLSLGCGYRRTIDKRNAGDGLSAVRRTRGLFWSHVRLWSSNIASTIES